MLIVYNSSEQGPTMGRYCLVVMSNPVQGKEDEYNEWYNNQHLKDVLKVPGFVAAQRFKAAEANGSSPRYMAIYEMETGNPQTVMAELERRAGTAGLVMSDAIDLNNISLSIFEVASQRLTVARA